MLGNSSIVARRREPSAAALAIVHNVTGRRRSSTSKTLVYRSILSVSSDEDKISKPSDTAVARACCSGCISVEERATVSGGLRLAHRKRDRAVGRFRNRQATIEELTRVRCAGGKHAGVHDAIAAARESSFV